METTCKYFKNHLEKKVKVKGWLTKQRSSGKIAFLEIRDGNGFFQVIAEKNKISEKNWEEIINLTQETALEVSGTINKHPKKEEYELNLTDLKIIHIPQNSYPISNKEHGTTFLFDNRHLFLRSKKQWAIQKIRNTIIKATYDFMEEEDFTKIDAPIFTPTSCEGTTTLYEVDHFGTPLYLSQSGQLYIESAIFAHRKVFDFGPVFRAEKSKTRRHLNEFWMMDAEMAFLDHQDNMELQEKLIKYIVKKVLEKNQIELNILERETEKLEKVFEPFIKMTYENTIKELQEMGSEIKMNDDLGATDETMLTEKYDQPIFIEKFPAKIKAFYMKRDPKNQDFILGSDLLAPEGYGEIIGGSEREIDYEVLLKRIKEENLDPEIFSWYLDLRKYGSVPHSGFGFGLERLVVWICGLKHVRESIPFPRTIIRYKP